MGSIPLKVILGTVRESPLSNTSNSLESLDATFPIKRRFFEKDRRPLALDASTLQDVVAALEIVVRFRSAFFFFQKKTFFYSYKFFCKVSTSVAAVGLSQVYGAIISQTMEI